MKRNILLLIISLFITSAVKAEEVPYISKKISTFFELLKSDPDKAINSYFSDSVFARENQDLIKQVKAKLNVTLAQLGSYRGNEIIIRRHLLNRFVTIKYLALFDRQPLTFQFEFYKPVNKWQIQGFTFDANIDDLLDESINFGIIKKLRIDSGDTD